jgi:Flp pilus assembly pilin Flp
MMTLAKKMWNDEAGYIVSAELILVATIGVLAMVVGLSEVSIGINEELEDIGSAFGAINQSYCYFGATGHKGHVAGSAFRDKIDQCDSACDIVCNTPITGEHWGWGH